VTRRLQVLFLLALLGVLVLLGLVVLALLGPVAAAVYAVAALAVLGRAAWRARADAAPVGRTCSCCTSTVHDPVEVR
jgi:hypothetical protein